MTFICIQICAKEHLLFFEFNNEGMTYLTVYISCCIYQVNSHKCVTLADELCSGISVLFSLSFYLLMGMERENTIVCFSQSRSV